MLSLVDRTNTLLVDLILCLDSAIRLSHPECDLNARHREMISHEFRDVFARAQAEHEPIIREIGDLEDGGPLSEGTAKDLLEALSDTQLAIENVAEGLRRKVDPS